MSFSVRLAPGLRVRASSRGLRTSIGPRAARLHVGAGRPGFSTGMGPVGYYTSLGGSGSGSAAARRPSTGKSSQALADAVKAQEGQRLADALDNIVNLHRQEFPAAQPPVAPEPPEPDESEIRQRNRTAAVVGIRWYQRTKRAAARNRADDAATVEIAQVRAENERVRKAQQADLDATWARLTANDPPTVLGVLATAFEDNQAAAAPVGVTGAEASLVVLVPGVDAVPEHRPTLTTAGNLTLKKLTKHEGAAFYATLVCGYAVATTKEAFAVAPGLSHARVVAVRIARTDSYGRPQLEALLGARFARAAWTDVRWQTADAVGVVQDTSQELAMRLTGRNEELVALDLSTEPEIAAALAVLDVDELLT